MKNERLGILKNSLEFVEMDQRLEMIKIPGLAELACGPETNSCCSTCPEMPDDNPVPAPAEPEVAN